MITAKIEISCAIMSGQDLPPNGRMRLFWFQLSYSRMSAKNRALSNAKQQKRHKTPFEDVVNEEEGENRQDSTECRCEFLARCVHSLQTLIVSQSCSGT